MTPDSKIDEPNEAERVVRAPRARWRVIMRRILKYTTLTFLFLASCATIFLWSADVQKEYSLILKYGKANSLVVSSRNGGVWFGGFSFALPSDPNFSVPPGIEYHAEKPSPDFVEKIIPPLTKLGVGIVTKVEVYNQITQRMAASVPLPGAFPADSPFVILNGLAIVIPHWMLLFALVSLFVFIAMGRRFTLRMFLIWVTIACVSLGIALRTAESSEKLKLLEQKTKMAQEKVET